ncbi:MAG TPA: SpoIIE family protein phosphatase [Bryobacteraceae bacterium]|nr:SpoIIE family protein phosphatase [Bryobacteraceae bacterium]
MPSAADSLRVLVADDQSDVLQAIRLLLKSAGHAAETVDSPAGLLRAAESRSFDVILMDMNYARDTTSGQEGLEVLRALRDKHNATPVIVMTAWGSVDLAVEAMRRGASDFVQKPWDNDRLLGSIVEQADRGRAVLRAREEADIARNVQRKLLPAGSREQRSMRWAGRCLPARDVGGDYFDFLDSGPEQLGVVLADVSGKGVAAALLMANLQALFRTHTDLRTINQLFLESTPPEQYATMFYGILDDRHRTFHYVNAGHPAALVCRRGGAVERLSSTTFPLGLFGDWTSDYGAVSLGAGDALVIYSDGVCEGDDAWIAERAVTGSPEEIADRITQQACDGGQTDDVTVVVGRAV